MDAGDWVKLRNESDYFLIRSIDQDRGYVEIEDITGHIWNCAIREVERTLTNKELYIKEERGKK